LSCRGCLLVKVDIPSGGDIDDCHKARLISEFKEKYGNSKKALFFLDFEIRAVAGHQCFKGIDEQSSLDFANQQSRAIERFKDHLERTLAWVELQPWSILRRKFAAKARIGAVRMHCCWVTCPNKTCLVRGRGRHCRKQKKITGYLQEA
jgi:hypothetical protein